MNSRLRTLAILLPLALAAGQGFAADEVYKWRDANGRWQYGSQPPPGIKAEKLTTTISTVPAYKPKPLGGLPPEPEEAPSAKAASPAVNSATRKQMLEACEKAGGTDCPSIVNAALNAAVSQAKANQAAGSSNASGEAGGSGGGSSAAPSTTTKPSGNNAY
jgi:hypothetical protein